MAISDLFPFRSSSTAELVSGTPSASSISERKRSKTSPEEIWSAALRAKDAEQPLRVVFDTCPEATIGAPLTARPHRLRVWEKHPLQEERPAFVVVRKEKRGDELVLCFDNDPGKGESFKFQFSPEGPSLALPSHTSSPMDDKAESTATSPSNHQDHDENAMRPTTTPRSPPSPTMHHISDASRKSVASELRLPKFHPLHYESQSQNSSQLNSPSSSRPSSSRSPLSPSLQTRKGGLTPKNAQQMQQYHRDVLARTVSTLAGPSSQPTTSETPRAPHLIPHGSPGPATPLMLPEPQDYIAARAIGEGSPRAVADRHIREDQERRSGMKVEGSSPAVSPRC